MPASTPAIATNDRISIHADAHHKGGATNAASARVREQFRTMSPACGLNAFARRSFRTFNVGTGL